MSYSIAEYDQSNIELIIKSFHEFLIRFFGKENVIWMNNDRRFKVRPMWVANGGSGFRPSIDSLVRMTRVAIDKFNATHNFRITQSSINDIPLIELCDSSSKKPFDYDFCVSVHHSPFF